MKREYLLHGSNINDMKNNNVYVGTIEFSTTDIKEMVDYISDLQDDMDEVYTVEEIESDWRRLSIPSDFVDENLRDFTIRTMTNGAVICTGVTAVNEDDACERFFALGMGSSYSEDDIYASPSKWND